uniref:Uncharacterized protein n=1 Tax=Arundo donax TaxID=35708 RepID=A0A0A8ZKU1_ARUDO
MKHNTSNGNHLDNIKVIGMHTTNREWKIMSKPPQSN